MRAQYHGGVHSTIRYGSTGHRIGSREHTVGEYGIPRAAYTESTARYASSVPQISTTEYGIPGAAYIVPYCMGVPDIA
eukprot:1855345-Rhodomonas_salina.3